MRPDLLGGSWLCHSMFANANVFHGSLRPSHLLYWQVKLKQKKCLFKSKRHLLTFLYEVLQSASKIACARIFLVVGRFATQCLPLQTFSSGYAPGGGCLFISKSFKMLMFLTGHYVLVTYYISR